MVSVQTCPELWDVGEQCTASRNSFWAKHGDLDNTTFSTLYWGVGADPYPLHTSTSYGSGSCLLVV